MIPHRLTPLVASLLTIALCGAVEPVVATPFDIRHDANELLDDLQARRGEPGALLERVQDLLARHGDSMITHGELRAPLAELFAIRMAELGMAELFAKTYDGTAERRLREGLRARVGEADLRALALSYPGTTAAAQAWRHLADQAWDSGRIGQYLDYARRAGDASDKNRGARVRAANKLLIPDHVIDLPGSLDGLEEMWRIDLSEALEAAVIPTEGQRELRLRRVRRNTNTQSLFTLSPADGELTAASDGQKFFLFDHLIGRMVGDVRTLGQFPLGQVTSRPAVTRNGFISLGWVDDHAVLMSLDRLGEVKWRWNSPSLGPVQAISAPVVLDNLVVFSALALGNQEGAELRALAFRVDTGRPAWNSLVARIPLQRQQMIFASNDMGMPSPTLAVHGGSLVVLSNNGLIARLGIDGNVNRLWTYPSMGDEFDNGFGNAPTLTRQGTIASDGTFLVASPSDSPGVILYLGPDDHTPQRFQGDGANGEVLDVVGGLALLAGPRSLALFDIAAGKVRWAVPFPGREGVQGRIGVGRVLVSTSEQLALIDSASGHIIGSRGLAKGVSLAITSDLVMAASNERIIGWGRGASFLERLTKAATTNPADYRPWGTLASFHESREDREKAFSCLLEALNRGAPVDYAERAARLVRGQLELGVGDEKTFPGPLAKLQLITVHDERLKGEVALWQGRNAELRGEMARAISSFRTAMTFPDHRMLLRNRLEARVHVLAQNGLIRLQAITDPAVAPLARRPLPRPSSAWNVPGRRGESLLVAGELAVGFSDGFLTAAKVSDGSLAWRRQPVRQLLGVRTSFTPNLNHTEGIPIQEVVPGSSADTAGMKNGDTLLTFQGKKTTNFDRDLRAVVATMAPHTPFTMTVLRNGAELELKGLLGGEPVEPLAANDHTLLLWLTTPLGVAGQPGLPGRRMSAPDGMWFAAVDLATGTELFRYGLKPTDAAGNTPPQPLLTANDLVLTQDGNDLVCLQAHAGKAGEAPTPLWRMPLGEDGMERLRVLSPELLWLPEDGRNRVHLIDLMTGVTRFVLPEDLAADPILKGNTCFCLGREGRITCWDLDIGRQRWRSSKVFGRLHGLSGDGLYATDENNQLVVIDAFSGDVRRRFGEWTAIESAITNPNTLSLFVRRADRSQALTRISLAGGHVQWEQALPAGAEVQHLVEAPDAFGAVLSEGEQRTVLMIGKDGTVRLAQRLLSDEQVMPVDDGLLAYGSTGMRVLPNVLPAAAPAVSCTVVEADGDLTAVSMAALPKLTWQPVSNAAYALARHRGSLLIFARLGSDNRPLGIRLGDGDQAIDDTGMMAIFSPTSPQFSGAGRWIVDGAKRLSADGEQPLLVLRLQPTPDRAPAAALLLRAECGEISDSGTAPWWLRRAWRSVTGGP